MKPRADLFREEAWKAQEEAGHRGAPLLLWSRWIDHTYFFIVAAAVLALGFAALAHVGEYARGPAVVRALGRLDLATANGGLVTAVEVEPGMRVSAGQTLVRFHSDGERIALENLDRQFELKVVRILLHPNDEATRQSLASLRAERELAEARLAERQVIAPRAGIVRNLRIRAGQLLAPGDLVLTLVEEADAAFTVVALLPGQFRPMLKPGMPLRFEIDGYPQIASKMVVESVGDEVIGPSEVRRYLGQALADAVPVEGSLVLVRAQVSDPTFRWKGALYRLYDGIPGRVDVRVRSVRLLTMLFPAFEEL